MKKQLGLILSLAILTAACGGGSDAGIETFFPADDEVAGWTENPAVGQAGVEVATSVAEAEALVNGDAESFSAAGFTAFARQHYVKAGGYQLELRIWEMNDAATAESIYADLAMNDSLYSIYTWETVAVGQAGRVADTGANWWVNARKGAYHIEAKINQMGTADPAARADVVAFVTAVAGAIP